MGKIGEYISKQCGNPHGIIGRIMVRSMNRVNKAAFDIVATMNTIYFWESTEQGMSEIYRVLKPGGVFYNAVITKEYLDKVFYTKSGFKKFENEDYEEVGKKAGFSSVEIKTLRSGMSLLVIYRK